MDTVITISTMIALDMTRAAVCFCFSYEAAANIVIEQRVTYSHGSRMLLHLITYYRIFLVYKRGQRRCFRLFFFRFVSHFFRSRSCRSLESEECALQANREQWFGAEVCDLICTYSETMCLWARSRAHVRVRIYDVPREKNERYIGAINFLFHFWFLLSIFSGVEAKKWEKKTNNTESSTIDRYSCVVVNANDLCWLLVFESCRLYILMPYVVCTRSISMLKLYISVHFFYFFTCSVFFVYFAILALKHPHGFIHRDPWWRWCVRARKIKLYIVAVVYVCVFVCVWCCFVYIAKIIFYLMVQEIRQCVRLSYTQCQCITSKTQAIYKHYICTDTDAINFKASG